jgi:hypothetical protein
LTFQDESIIISTCFRSHRGTQLARRGKIQ